MMKTQNWWGTKLWFDATLESTSIEKNHFVRVDFINGDFFLYPLLKGPRDLYFNADHFYSPHFDDTFFLNSFGSTPEFSDTTIPYFVIIPVLGDISFRLKFSTNFKTSYFSHSLNWRAFSTSSSDYWDKRPTVLINTIKRKRKKFLEAGCHFEFHTQLSEQLRDYYWVIYQRSWKPDEASSAFINWLLDYTFEQGLLRLAFAFKGSKPIAMQFWIVQHGTASIFKLAQDKAFDALSPGTVLMAEMVDWVYANDEIHCIDFLTGDDDYKKLWMDESRPLYGLEIFNVATIRGRFLWYRHCIKTLIKKWLGRA